MSDDATEPSTENPQLPLPFWLAQVRVLELSNALMADSWPCHEWTRELPPEPADEKELARGQFILRTFVRTFFAQVEGVAFAMRETVLELHTQGHVKLSPGEYCILAETSFVCDGGEPKERRASNKMLDNLKLAFKAFTKAYGIHYELDLSDHRFGSFRRALKTRDGLAHPKSVADLRLSSERIAELADSIAWFSKQMTGLLAALLTRL